jgi:lipid-binding SYLF domain-containing protein
LFAGVALEGAGMTMDRKANAAFYGSASITPEQIFAGSGNAAPQEESKVRTYGYGTTDDALDNGTL